MKRTGVAVLSALLLTSCQQRDLGTGLNTVTRDYARPVPAAWEAAVDAAEALEFRVERERHDHLGGDLHARRADQSEVEIEVKYVDPNLTRISVYVSPGNVEWANRVHEQMADEMGLGKALPEWWLFGANSLGGKYARDLDSCLTAAERACETLDFLVLHEEKSEASALIEARLRDSTPVRIEIKTADKGETEMTFIVGRVATDENKTWVRRLKEEFEKGVN